MQQVKKSILGDNLKDVKFGEKRTKVANGRYAKFEKQYVQGSERKGKEISLAQRLGGKKCRLLCGSEKSQRAMRLKL